MRPAGRGATPDRIEIRLLGPLQVRRADGTWVRGEEWRTGKAVDLLRLLALHSGRAVPVATLLDRLWPAAEEARARASLRTATSEIRRVLRQDCIHRHLGGLVLRHAWVDAVSYQALAAEARTCLREGLLARGVSTTREAEALYLGDFRSNDDNAQWASEEREGLVSVRRELVLSAASAAVELGWMRDAVEFSSTSLQLEPSSERASRSLMRAYAGLGETERALREYQRCSAALAEEFGVDPSPQTRAVYLELIASEPPPATATTFVGRDDEKRRLTDVLSTALERRLPTVVRLSGDVGSGRRGLVTQVCATIDSGCIWVNGSEPLPVFDAQDPRAVVAVLDADSLTDQALRALLVDAASAGATAVVLVLSTSADRHHSATTLPSPWRAVEMALAPLASEELAELVRAVLAGPPSPQLVADLEGESEGNRQRAVGLLAAWSRTGRVAATARGLVLMPPELAGGHDVDGQTLLGQAVEQLPPDQLEVLHVASLFERPVLPNLLAPLVAPTGASESSAQESVRAVLDTLVDLSLLTVGATGYAFRSPLVRETVVSWLRPTARRHLHRRIAQEADIPPAERIRHWQEAGEPQLACAATLDAAREAVTGGRLAAARTHLRQVVAMAALLGTDSADLAELYGQLGDVCTRVGRIDEARQAYATALGHSPLPPVTEAPVAPAGIVARLDHVEHALLPRRLLEQSRRTLADARALTVEPGLAARAELIGALLEVLLGNAREALPSLHRLGAALPHGSDQLLAARVDVVRMLAAHDLGLPSFADLWADVRVRDVVVEDWSWAAIRILTERGALDQAAEVERATGEDPLSPLAGMLRRVAVAMLRQASGHLDEARALLRAAADEAVATGCTLLLPEVGSRLVLIEAGIDTVAAREYFDLVDWAVGSEPDQGREACLRLLARAAVREAAGDLGRAAAAAQSAAQIAAGKGLVLLAGEAHDARARYLAAAGRTADAWRAQQMASRCFGAAGLGLHRRVQPEASPA